jgi:hypothetical protein
VSAAHRRVTAVLLGAAVVVLLAGCGGAAKEPVSTAPFSPADYAPTSTSAPAKAVDYTPLLLQGSDIYAPGDIYVAPPPIRDPHGSRGAEELMVNGDQTRAIGITIIVVADDVTAMAESAKALANLSTVVPSAPPAPVPVGAGGTAVTGLSHDGAKAVTALVFSADRAIVRIDFYSVPGQGTPMDFVTEVGLKQAIALRVGLPRMQ